MTEESRGKRLAAQRILLFWMVGSFVVLGCTLYGIVPETHLSALQGIYGTFTGWALAVALGLWGLDASAAQIIPAWKR